MNRALDSMRANLKVEGNRLTLHLEMPVEWALVILVALLILLTPEFWQAIQTALSVIH
jgi:hypothetical protein